MTRIDSRIEEWIGSLPGMWWFDSRRSGDLAGYVHKLVWAALASAAAYLIGVPAWWGAALYLAIYTPLKIHDTLVHWREWRSGESRLGPWRDYREPPRPGVNFGFIVDALLDLLVVVGATLFVYWRIG